MQGATSSGGSGGSPAGGIAGQRVLVTAGALGIARAVADNFSEH